MGFDTDLKEIFEFKYLAEFNNWLIENEYDHVFIGHYDWVVNPNKEEVNDFKWVSIPDIQDDIFAEPGIYTQWFKIILGQYSSSIE
jgi:isopentenyl-diphosphate delta-isomerase